MELIKKNIHLNGWKARAATQITVDEDVNVPDAKPDVGRIIQEKAVFHIDEVKGEENQALLKGTVAVDILYSGAEDAQLHVCTASLPVEERLHIDGISASDNIHVKGTLDDVSVAIINSRKINVKGILSLSAQADEHLDKEVLVELKDDTHAVQTMSKSLELLQMTVHKKDHCRMKDEIVLSSAKPNIYELIWYQVQPQNVEIKLLADQISVHGEMKVFVLYTGEEEGHPVQIVEEILPFHCTLECSGCSEEMISQTGWELTQVNMEVRPDVDGEERMFGIEAVVELDIRLFREENLEILADAYSTAGQLWPVTEELPCHRLLIKNQSKSRVSGTLGIGKNQPRILQIYQAVGTVRIDDVQIVEEGILAEGVVNVWLFYVTSDDEMPYASIRGQIPFQQMIEVPEMEEDAEYMIQAHLEQLQAMMSDSEEVEFKGTVSLGVLVMGRCRMQAVTDVNEQPLDYERLNDIPGMVGYIAGEGDTLWNIAKQYSTTVDVLRQMNDFKGEEVSPGDRFLIMKTVMG